MLEVIRRQLAGIMADIDAGNSVLTEDEALRVAECIGRMADSGRKLSKCQACRYLNVSRATFDNYVRAGLLPRGSREAGFKEKFWTRRQLDSFLRGRADAAKE